jgi:UDP-N-acetyl-D-mannosaminuronate dehydrogenase
MPRHAVAIVAERLGDLTGLRVAVLGAAYRGAVKETAFSGVFDVVRALEERGAVATVHDPMYDDDELAALGFAPHHLGELVDAAIVQTDHAAYAGLTLDDLPGVRLVLNGRPALQLDLPAELVVTIGRASRG